MKARFKYNFYYNNLIFKLGIHFALSIVMDFWKVCSIKVENILEGSTVSIPSPSPSVKIQKVCLRFKNVCWHHPAMFCLITSNKLSRLWFKFSLKEKVMGSNPGYLLKYFLLYIVCTIYDDSEFETILFKMQRLRKKMCNDKR